MSNKNDRNEKPTTEVKKCDVCLIESTLTCSNCNKIYYCSKEHQKQDWKEHKINCKPYEIVHNNDLGRYLIASKDIKQGEIIIKERPIAIGPSMSSVPLCLKCYRPIIPNKKHIFCLKCGVAPLCSLTCNANGHTNKECETFKSNPNITSSNIFQHYQIILPLRCLALRESDPKTWQEFIKMESHINERRGTTIWQDYKVNVEDVIKQFGILKDDDLEEELMQKISGILDVNTFELRVPGFETNIRLENCLRGVFVQTALMAHDCVGNTHMSVDDSFNIIVHASLPIQKGELIYFNYTNALNNTYDRQKHLKIGKYFDCTCKRCLDSTECETYMSSLLCVRCKKGFLSPVQTIGHIYKNETIWKCSDKECNYQCGGSLIKTAVDCAKDFIDETDKRNINDVEKLIKKMLETFSPNHSIIIDLKQNLIGLYSEFLRQDMNPNKKVLHRKLELCQELLPILEKVEPGISRLTGITLYELHIPLVIIANREYDNGEITAEVLLKRMLQAEEVLKKAVSYLLYEPAASPEGRLAANAMNELKLLRNSVISVEQIVQNKKENIDKRRKKKK